MGKILMSGQKYFTVLFMTRISLMRFRNTQNTQKFNENSKKEKSLINITVDSYRSNCSFLLFEVI